MSKKQLYLDIIISLLTIIMLLVCLLIIRLFGMEHSILYLGGVVLGMSIVYFFHISEDEA